MSEKKTNKIFQLIQLFVEKKTICKNGNIFNQQGILIQKIEDKNEKRKLNHYLTEIEENYPHIVKIKKSGSHCYKLESVSEIFYSFLSNSEETSELLRLIYDSDKNLMNELAEETQANLDKISKKEKNIFLFQGLPFDELKEPKRKEIFNTLKVATKNNEYRDIHYHYNNPNIFKNAQCLKLIFMDSNWYIAINSQERGFRLLRVAFITLVQYSKKETYQSNKLTQYSNYFKTIQNPMTLYGVEKKIGHFLASPKVAKYFKPNMKKYLNSQTFIAEREDGSIEFTLEYTQSLEVLPFIKKYLPDIEVLSPPSLKEKMLEDLRAYLNK